MLFHWQRKGKVTRNWKLSAPFIFTVEIGSTRESGNICGTVPLSGLRLINVFERILSHGKHIFIEDHGPNIHTDVFSIFRMLDEQKVRYHFQTPALWKNPRSVLSKLQQLRYLETLRIVMPTSHESTDEGHLPDHTLHQVFGNNLELAVASGLKVWAVIPLAEKIIKCFRDMVENFMHVGVKGVAVERNCNPAITSPNVFLEKYKELQGLFSMGYRVVLDDCAPNGLSSGIVSRCRGGLGSCHVDAHGNVRVCRQATDIVGNLLKESTLVQIRF